MKDDVDRNQPTGAWLAVDRKALGISLPDAAELLQVSQNVIRNWERGRRTPGQAHQQQWRSLVAEHTEQAEALARTDGPWQIRSTSDSRYPPGWAVAVVVRARDIRRTLGLTDPVIEWAADGEE